MAEASVSETLITILTEAPKSVAVVLARYLFAAVQVIVLACVSRVQTRPLIVLVFVVA